MIFYSDKDKRRIIMDHYLNPLNHQIIEDDSFKKSYHHSDACADDISLYLKDNQIFFSGKGCAIYLASTDIFIEVYKKSNLDLVLFSKLYQKMLNQEVLDKSELAILDKLIIFKNVKQQMNREECALMIAKAIDKL